MNIFYKSMEFEKLYELRSQRLQHFEKMRYGSLLLLLGIVGFLVKEVIANKEYVFENYDSFIIVSTLLLVILCYIGTNLHVKSIRMATELMIIEYFNKYDHLGLGYFCKRKGRTRFPYLLTIHNGDAIIAIFIFGSHVMVYSIFEFSCYSFAAFFIFFITFLHRCKLSRNVFKERDRIEKWWEEAADRKQGDLELKSEFIAFIDN